MRKFNPETMNCNVVGSSIQVNDKVIVKCVKTESGFCEDCYFRYNDGCMQMTCKACDRPDNIETKYIKI